MTIIDPRQEREAERRERSLLIGLRAALLIWTIFVAGSVVPALWLAWLAVPYLTRRYRRRLERGSRHL